MALEILVYTSEPGTYQVGDIIEIRKSPATWTAREKGRVVKLDDTEEAKLISAIGAVDYEDLKIILREEPDDLHRRRAYKIDVAPNTIGETFKTVLATDLKTKTAEEL